MVICSLSIVHACSVSGLDLWPGEGRLLRNRHTNRCVTVQFFPGKVKDGVMEKVLFGVGLEG